MPKPPRAEFILVPYEQMEQSLYGFLDMLRYDRAEVQDVSHEYVILRTTRRFTIARWRSFGIRLLGPEVQSTDYGDQAQRTLVEQWQRTLVEPWPSAKESN
jgi:hypothetical protein